MARLVTLFLFAPSSALACAVCFDSTAKNRQAFVDTTIVMTALPLLMITGGAWWLYKRSQRVAHRSG